MDGGDSARSGTGTRHHAAGDFFVVKMASALQLEVQHLRGLFIPVNGVDESQSRPQGLVAGDKLKKAGRYDVSKLPEAQFEPGSHGRVLRNLLGIKRKREMDTRLRSSYAPLRSWSDSTMNPTVSTPGFLAIRQSRAVLIP